MLRELADSVEKARIGMITKPVSKMTAPKQFLKAGTTSGLKSANIPLPSILEDAMDWEMAVDLPGFQTYPELIKKSGKRPDIVLHSEDTKQMILIELTVPFESRMDEQHTYKVSKYSDLV